MLRSILFYSIAAILLTASSLVEAQQSQRIYKIGRLNAGSPTDPRTKLNYEAFRESLRDLGWIEGDNITFENRWANGVLGNAENMANELVRLKVDVIVAVGSPMVSAAKRATKVVPIVMSGTGADPVAAGFVLSIGRPGGNITGLSMLSTELSGKRLELLKDIKSKLDRVAVLRNADFPAVAIQSKETEVAAKALGLQLQQWDVRNRHEIDDAFSSMNASGVGGLIVFSDPVILEKNRGPIIGLALKYRLPAIYPWRDYVEEGGLTSYAASLPDMHRRAATYVDKILKGANPADVPVEQPTKFELTINLKAAKQIGLTIPPNVLVRADKVIK